MQYFDQEYFHKLARLSIGSVASLAEPMEPNAVREAENPFFATLFPNPATHLATLTLPLEAPANVSWTLYNAMGQVVLAEASRDSPAGHYRADISVDKLPAGVYQLKIDRKELNGNTLTNTKRLVVSPR